MSIKYKNNEDYESSTEIYKKISETIVKLVEDNNYLDDETKIYSVAISLVSLSADLLSQTTDLDQFDILSMLTKALSENLNIDFIIEDDCADDEDYALEDKKATIKKSILN